MLTHPLCDIRGFTQTQSTSAWVCFFEKSFRVPKNRLRLIVRAIGRDKTIVPKVCLMLCYSSDINHIAITFGNVYLFLKIVFFQNICVYEIKVVLLCAESTN